MPKKIISVVLLLCTFSVFGQEVKEVSLDDLIVLAKENNAGLKANSLEIQQAETNVKTAFTFDKTYVYYSLDQNNLAANNEPLRVFGVQQDFRFPTVYFSEKKVRNAEKALISSKFSIEEKALTKNVTASFYRYQIANKKASLYQKLDSLYTDFSKMATRRFELGETNYLEKITAASKQKRIHLAYAEALKNAQQAYENIVKFVQAEDSLQIQKTPFLKVARTSIAIDKSAELTYYEQRISLSEASRSLEKQKLLPDISINYFQGSNPQLNDNLYGYQFGLKIPLLFGGQAAKIKAAKIAEEIAKEEAVEYETQLKSSYKTLDLQLIQLEKSLTYFEQEGAKLSDEILKTAQGSFKNGEIDFYQYIQSLESAYEVKLDYLDKLEEYNQTVITINYLTL